MNKQNYSILSKAIKSQQDDLIYFSELWAGT